METGKEVLDQIRKTQEELAYCKQVEYGIELVAKINDCARSIVEAIIKESKSHNVYESRAWLHRNSPSRVDRQFKMLLMLEPLVTKKGMGNKAWAYYRKVMLHVPQSQMMQQVRTADDWINLTNEIVDLLDAAE